MAYGTPSGVSVYAPFSSDIVSDALERCGIYFPEGRHLTSARRSTNLLLASDWANRGINLWTVSAVPYLIDLIEGTPTYNLPPNTISMLDTYLSIPSNGTTITVAGQGASIIPYLVGNPVPQNSIISTVQGSNIANVNWPAHGLTSGMDCSILYPVVVGGLTLGGVYAAVTIIDANNFTINTTFLATSTSSMTIMGTGTSDRILGSISRTDYAGLAQKQQPGAPSCFWFNRQTVPQVTLWPVPDGNGPYQLQAFLVTQIDNVYAANGETLDMPQRFFYACVTDLARDLSIKFAPDKYQLLMTEAQGAWERASTSDVERVTMSIMPNFGGYGT
ncbi:MAG TPA: hypothetical protein VGG45_16180 [Terracidiphilus sp.]